MESVPGPEVIKPFSCSAQLRLKFILLINVKMPLIVGILTFMRRIHYQFLRFELEFSTTFDYFSIYEMLKFQAELEKSFITSGPVLLLTDCMSPVPYDISQLFSQNTCINCILHVYQYYFGQKYDRMHTLFKK